MPKDRKAQKAKVKQLNPRIYIYCEGTETERNYFLGYLSERYQGNNLVQFVDIPKIKQNTPKSIVQRIVNDKVSDQHLDGDIHWAVYDRESQAKISDEEHLDARNLAINNNINIAFTNVCIEQWFVFHFLYSKAPYTSCKNLLDDSPLKKKLKERGLRKYDKANAELYDYLSGGVEKAREIARSINNDVIADLGEKFGHDEPHKLNPYSNVYEVLDEIDRFLMRESFNSDFIEIKKLVTWFCSEGFEQVDQDKIKQKVAWGKVQSIFEKYLSEQAKFSKLWRELSIEFLVNEMISLEDIDNFYYQNIAT
ncbi:RloB family protein [Vibrio crassostreae]|uniref:RloB family protein n=1 Tax=Vibrio crassostreae TaxID=246167 RepID=UPI001B314AD4|nr:RloB family protein [Vibrio crassostreae]